MARSKIPELVWQLCETNIQQFASDIDIHFIKTVHYEHFVSDPNNVVTEIFRFLGIEPFEVDINSLERQSDLFAKDYAGDMKYFLTDKIDSTRASAWQDFPELHEVSPITTKLYAASQNFCDV